MIWLLIIGLVAGGLFGSIMKDDELELAGDFIVGTAGALIGGNVYSIAGVAGAGIIIELSLAAGGAIVMLLILRLVLQLPFQSRLEGMPEEDVDTEN